MAAIDPSFPRAIDPDALAADPIRFLAQAHSRHGDLFLLREDAPLFSPGPDCPAVIAVFGRELQRRVLADAKTFAMPDSASRALSLPPVLANLNRSLHGMTGPLHRSQKQALSAVLAQPLAPELRERMVDRVAAFAAAWIDGGTVEIFTAMRHLSAELALLLLFGGDDPALAQALEAWFRLRRSAASPLATRGGSAEALVEAGERLDALLRVHIRGCRRGGAGIVARLARAQPDGAAPLSEDRLVAHANVLYMSMTEPVPVALTWLQLLLSQCPSLRARLQAEAETSGTAALLEQVVLETLRLLSPNAIMVRVASRPTEWGGMVLPEGCEFVLCPFLSHRDPAVFAEPVLFRPSRWAGLRPSPHVYFPFGAGPHACVGRGLAMSVLMLAAAELARRVRPVLDGALPIDWQIDITFRPRGEIALTAASAGDARGVSQPWSGPVSELVRFDCDPA